MQVAEYELKINYDWLFVRINFNGKKVKKDRVVYNFIKRKKVHCHAETRNRNFWFLFSFYSNPSVIAKMIRVFCAIANVNMNMKVKNKG